MKRNAMRNTAIWLPKKKEGQVERKEQEGGGAIQQLPGVWNSLFRPQANWQSQIFRSFIN